MKKKMIVTALAFALLVPMAIGTEIGIQPSEYQVNLTAGQTKIQEVNLTWNKDSTVYVNLTTEITDSTGTPSGEGINVTYSENPVKIKNKETLEVIINTQVNLAPGQYTITTDSDQVYEHEKETETIYTGGGGGTTTTITEENKTLRNLYKQLQETIEKKKSKITQLNQLIQSKNTTQKQYKEEALNLTTQINKLKQEKQNLIQRIQRIKNKTQQQKTKITGTITNKLTPILTGITTILLLITLYTYTRYKKAKAKDNRDDDSGDDSE